MKLNGNEKLDYKIENTNRKEWCDILRIIAIVLVVFNHSVQYAYPVESVGLASWSLRSVLFTIGRCGVPLFLFLSGSLLLSKKIENASDLKKYFKHNFLPLLITSEAWIFLYHFFLHFTGRRALDLEFIIKDALFITKTPLNHMWYIPMIIGIYVAVPFIALLIKTFNSKLLLIPFVLGAFSGIILPTINTYITVYDSAENVLPFIINVYFFGGTYGTYIICGYLITEKQILARLHPAILAVILLSSFSLSIKLQIDSFTHDPSSPPYVIFYQSIYLLICGMMIYEFGRRYFRIKKELIRKILFFFSKLSFGVFFVHNMILLLLLQYANLPIERRYILVVVLFIISTILSYIICALLSKIPLVNRILLNTK